MFIIIINNSKFNFIFNRFYARKSGAPCFYIFTGKPKEPTLNSSRLVDFTFHPTEPFAISIVKDHAELIVNFHIHKEYMPV